MAAHEGRQLAFVIDLNKCMGCQTCVVACKTLCADGDGADHIWWIKVNTMPGRGYPQDWESMGGGYDSGGGLLLGKGPEMKDYGGAWRFNHEEVYYSGQGQQVRLAPVDATTGERPTWGPNWDEDIGAGEYPNAYLFYLPRLCNHCSRPSCAEACPWGAITKRAEDGLVLIDEERCAQCQEPVCMGACPYKEIFFSETRHAAQKCNGCVARLADGVAPACVRQCPGRCVWVDFLDNREGPPYKLLKEWEVALPLHAEFNTEPNVFYIPPLAPPRIDANGDSDESEPRIPLDYLRSLFGSGVDRALASLQAEMARRREGEDSDLMDILIARRWQELLGPYPKDPAEVKS